MKKITVEGYTVTVEKDGDNFIVSVPELPGCTVEVYKEKDIVPIMKRIIGEYLRELASRKPKIKESKKVEPKGGNKLKPTLKVIF